MSVEAAIRMPETFGEFVLRLRGRLSREDVSAQARLAGHKISPSYIRKIEEDLDLQTGRPPSMTLEKLEALAAGLNVSRDVLVAERDKRQRRPTKGAANIGAVEEEKPRQPRLGLGSIEQPFAEQMRDKHITSSGLRFAIKRQPVYHITTASPWEVPGESDEHRDLLTHPAATHLLIFHGDGLVAASIKDGAEVQAAWYGPQAGPETGHMVLALVDAVVTVGKYQIDERGAYLELPPSPGKPWRLPLRADVEVFARVLKVSNDATMHELW